MQERVRENGTEDDDNTPLWAERNFTSSRFTAEHDRAEQRAEHTKKTKRGKRKAANSIG